MAIEKTIKKILLELSILDEFAEGIEIATAKEVLTYWFRCAVSNDGGAHENEIELYLKMMRFMEAMEESD